jgi:predicted MFS family arabinose efflux permease
MTHRATTVDQRPPHKVWTLVLASLGVFMTALDTLVVTNALPVLRTDLGASLGDLEWTVNAYNLCFACLLLTTPRSATASAAGGCSASDSPFSPPPRPRPCSPPASRR